MREENLAWVARACAVVALVVGAVVFCGWIFAIEWLQNPIPGYVGMKCNTALSILALALGVLLMTGGATRRRPAAVLAGWVILLVGVTAIEALTGGEFGVDTLLAVELPGTPGTAHPGQMAPPTMVALLAGAFALALFAWGRGRAVARRLAGADAVFGLLVLLGYTFHARQLYAAGFSTNVAVMTGAAFLFLGTSLLLLDPPPLLRSPYAGGVLFRRMLPVVLLAPWLIGWASLHGAEAGLYDFGIDQVICIAPLMVLFMVVLVLVADSLDRSDAERARKAAEIDGWNRELEGRVAERTAELDKANRSLRRLNRDLEMLRRCNRSLVHATDEHGLLHTICELAVNLGGYSLAWVGFAENDEHKTVRRAARSGPAAAYLDEISVSWTENDPFGRGPTGRAIRENKPFIGRQDGGANSEFEPWQQAAARYGIRTSLALPLRSAEGVFGALALHSSDPEAFDQREIDLFQELADDLAYGITTLRARRQIARSEEAVVAERHKLNTILDMLPCYIALVARDHRVIYANREFQSRFGTRNGRRCFEMLYGRSSPCQPCPTFSVFETGTPLNREWTDCSGRSYEVCDFPFTDTDGAGLILEMGVDVTAKKRMESELSLNERRYRSLVTATARVVWMTGPDGQVDDMPMWRDLTGQTREQVRGWGWLDAVIPGDRERVAAAWNAARAQGRLYDVEYRIRHADGRCFDLAVRGVPVLNDDGAVREWIGTCTDITERKIAEQEIRQLNTELEERVRQRTAELESSNKDLEAFTYSVSHDLRAPLRHLDGFSRLLLEDYGPHLEPGAVQHLTRIRDAAGRLGQLVDDLLQFSRLGRHPLQPQITGLAAVVREVIAELAPETEGRNLQWRISELPFVECDAALVKQVFANLLANAVKFTRPRAPAVIEIGHQLRDGEPVLFVRDNGVGFSMKYAAKLFGVFQRLHRPEDFEGTGVGLATVQRIVQKHGGRIWAEAELDHGAVFYFTLNPSPGGTTLTATETTKERLAV